MAIMTRRGALAGLGAVLGSSATGGCGGWLTGDLHAKLPDPDPATPLTIDAHSHVFNLSDSQFADFVKHAHPDQAWIVDMLGALGKAAPKADHELSLLEGAGFSFADLRDQQYREARESIAIAQKRLQASANPRKFQSSQVIAAKLQELPPSYAGYKIERRAQRQLRLRAALQKRRAMLRSAPAAATAATAARCAGGTNENVDANALFDFVLRNFHYRYANVHDYIEEYSAGPQRKIDIMITQIIDYDWPLGSEQATPSSLHDQVKVMERIMKMTNGRVLNFAPFCPFKQAAYFRGIAGVGNPMDIVQEAVLKRGHIGVKIYPPMGFLPFGNKHLVPGFWNGTPVRKELVDSKLGQDLDDALDVLYTWCIANDVPVMAHTSPGNVADCKYIGSIMPPENWQAAIDAYPGLRVNFAHFGHTDIVANHHHNAGVLVGYMDQGPTGKGRNVYADAGYFAEVLTDTDQLELELGALMRDTAGKGDAALSRRLMYGTDWEMVIIEGGTTAYLDLFERVIDNLAKDPTINPNNDLADRFFGLNAASYLGLRSGEANRWRLERFFGSKTLPWMVKVDKAGAKLQA